jgi:hypothetical protein
MNKENKTYPEQTDTAITYIKPNNQSDLSARLYLAVARKQISDRLIRVYTFGCPGFEHDGFYVRATTDVATFKSATYADMYVNQVKQAIQSQSQWPLFNIARNLLQRELEQFYKMVK